MMWEEPRGGGDVNPDYSCFPMMLQMLEEGSTLLRRMEICIAEAEKRSGKNAMGMQETFTVYLIETRRVAAAPRCGLMWG